MNAKRTKFIFLGIFVMVAALFFGSSFFSGSALAQGTYQCTALGSGSTWTCVESSMNCDPLYTPGDECKNLQGDTKCTWDLTYECIADCSLSLSTGDTCADSCQCSGDDQCNIESPEAGIRTCQQVTSELGLNDPCSFTDDQCGDGLECTALSGGAFCRPEEDDSLEYGDTCNTSDDKCGDGLRCEACPGGNFCVNPGECGLGLNDSCSLSDDQCRDGLECTALPGGAFCRPEEEDSPDYSSGGKEGDACTSWAGCEEGLACIDGTCVIGSCDEKEYGLVPCGGPMYDDDGNIIGQCPKCEFRHLFVLLHNLVNTIIFTIGPALVAIMILVGGFMILVSKGNAGLLSKGKNIVKWALLGYLIVLFAWVIVNSILMMLDLAEWVDIENWWNLTV
ncbi:MAG: pilin [Candidatus Spechtbacterales bacterium]